MKKFSINLYALLLLFSLSFFITPDSKAQENVFFSETGHSISGNFLNFYNSFSNAEDLFGLPITDVFVGNLGNQLQYFQNIRLEEDVFGNVSLSPIGILAYKSDNQTVEQNSELSCQTSQSWDFPICFEFWDFYNHNGNEIVFGKPISGLEKESERLVQYFENMLLEWIPEDLENPIKVGNLGSSYFLQKNENLNLLSISTDNDESSIILELQIQTFVEDSILNSSGVQILYVHVTDQNGTAVENVEINSSLVQSHENTILLTLPNNLTDENGIVKIEFDFESSMSGIVRILTTANFQDISISSETSFHFIN